MNALISWTVLLVASTFARAETARELVMRSRQLLASEFERPTRVTFRAWASHGEFAPSPDGRYLYFGENGREGLVLKRASVSDGSVVTIFRGTEEIDHLTAVPGKSDRLVVAWKVGLGGSPRYGISVVDLTQGRERRLDLGTAESDGELYVSPSGRFLATGTGLVGSCRPWFASEVAVFSLASGKREFTYTVPLDGGSPSPEDGDSAAICTRQESRVAWTSGDALIIQDRGSRAFQRRGDNWKKVPARGIVQPRLMDVQQVIVPDEPLILRRRTDGQSVELASGVLFPPGGKISVYNVSKYAVALREDSGDGRQSSIEAVVLEWKKRHRVSTPVGNRSQVLLSDASTRLTAGGGVTQVVVEMNLDEPVNAAAGVYRGEVSIAVRLPRKSWVRTNVSALLGLPSMQFVENPWELTFEDYNRDGRLDFNLGQSRGSNFCCYWLFAVETSGRVSLIPVEGHPLCKPGGVLDSSGDIERTEDGISTSFYDPAEGAGVEVRYRWDASAGSFVAADHSVTRQ